MFIIPICGSPLLSGEVRFIRTPPSSSAIGEVIATDMALIAFGEILARTDT
jgi:hypothetical protein